MVAILSKSSVLDESSLTSYYTPLDLVKAIWEKVLSLGFNGGRVLEPSCGDGRFFSQMPKTLINKVDLYGVELEESAANEAKVSHPQAKIYNQDFSKLVLPDDYFDLVIGNVPFGKYKLADPRYDALNLSIHNYFIAKSLDLARDGGLIALITSPFTLDAKGTKFREWLALRANLLTAIRLPQVFANTNVCADLIILQKNVENKDLTEEQLKKNPNFSWIHATNFYYSSWDWFEGDNNPKKSDTVVINDYFASELYERRNDLKIAQYYKRKGDESLVKKYLYQQPHKLLGIPVINQYGNNLALQDDGRNILQAILEVGVDRENLKLLPKPETKELEKILVPEDLQKDLKNNALCLYNTRVYSRDGAWLIPSTVAYDKVMAFKSLVSITKKVLHAQQNLNNGELTLLQQDLKENYESFVNKFGTVNSTENTKELGQDSDYILIRTLEKTEKKKVVGRADIFTKRVVKQYNNLEKANTLEDAISLSFNAKGRLDTNFISLLLNANEEDVIKELSTKELIYFNPNTQEWEHKDKYLSGNIHKKILEAKDVGLENNILALQKARPLPMLPTVSRKNNADEDSAELNEEEAFKIKCLTELDWSWEDLTEAQQKRILSKNIDAKIGAFWISEQYHKAFAHEVLRIYGLNSVKYVPSPVSTWYVDPVKSSDTTEYGTSEMSSAEILVKVLNNQEPIVNIYDRDKKRIPEASEYATEEARGKATLIKQAFAEWIWSDEERALDLCKAYNTTVNIYAARKYDGSWLDLPGLSPSIKLRPWQRNAVARIIENRATFLAHDVGLGKSLVMICGVMELRRLGICHKPMLVVLNGTEQQIYDEFKKAYPLANVFIPDKLDGTELRKLFSASLLTADFDCTIITHSQFFELTLGKEYQVQFLEQEKEILQEMLNSREFNKYKSIGARIIKKTLETLEDKLFEAKNPELQTIKIETVTSKGKKGSRNLNKKEKAAIKAGKNLEALNLRVLESSRKHDHINFEGVTDCLVIDEIHQMKNLHVTTKLQNIRGIPTSHSQRATDTYTKILYCLDNLINNAIDKAVTKDGRAIGATGTIFSNTLAEIYNWQRMFQLPLLKELGISSFDAWVSQFAEAVSSAEISPEGVYKVRTRLKRFSNLSILHATMSQFVDIVTFDMVGAKGGREFGLIRPEAKYIDVVSPASESQLKFLSRALVRAEAIRSGDVSPTEDNFLKITIDLTKAALSMRLLGGKTESPESKLHEAAFNILHIWRKTTEFKGVQLAFCDFSTPKPERYSVYVYLKNLLVALGIPEKEIEFIYDHNGRKRGKLFDRVNAGEVRIILGSTSKLGTGCNLHKNGIWALHHIDAPWRPSDIEQREGRGIRQLNGENLGKTLDSCLIFRYITEILDTFRWQTLQWKQEASKSFLNGADIDGLEDTGEVCFSFAQVKSLATGNPLLIEETNLRAELNSLLIQERSHKQQQLSLSSKINGFSSRIKEILALVDAAEKDLGKVNSAELLTEEEKETENKKIVAKFEEFSESLRGGAVNGTTRICGQYRGLEIFATNIGAHLNYSVKGFKSYGFPFKLSPDKYLSMNKTNPIGTVERFITEGLVAYLDRLKTELEECRLEQNRCQNMRGKEFPQTAKINEMQARLLEIRELMKEEKAPLGVFSGDTENESEEEDEGGNEFWLRGEFSEEGTDLTIAEEVIKEILSRQEPEYLHSVIEPQFIELRAIAGTRDLSRLISKGQFSQIKDLYAMCRSFPQHWQAGVRGLNSVQRKVVMKTLAA